MTPTTLSFGDGSNAQVAIVTGAARGLGRSWALALAARGVRVVVNDNDPDRSLVDAVVREIASKGGVAVGDYHSVSEDAKKIADNALKHFQRIDILINNATIIRDGSFRKMTVEKWDAVYKSSLFGTFLMTQAVWPQMSIQKYGRILNCVSGAGLYGNFGQVNYAAMKMGLVGFTVALNREGLLSLTARSALKKHLVSDLPIALVLFEGVKYNIHVNAVSPVASTRLTQPLWPDDVSDALKPELTAPIIVYLCHPSCTEAGSLFELGGGWVGKLRVQRTHGVGFPTDPAVFTPELVADQWKEVSDFSRVTHPTTTQESFEPMMRNARSPPSSLTTSRSHECAEVFDRLRTTLQTGGASIANSITGVLEWHINQEVWTISLVRGNGTVIAGRDKRLTPDLQIHMDEHDFLDLAHGKLRLQQVMYCVVTGHAQRWQEQSAHLSLHAFVYCIASLEAIDCEKYPTLNDDHSVSDSIGGDGALYQHETEVAVMRHLAGGSRNALGMARCMYLVLRDGAARRR
ncbi:Estradiol 17beta-dehydrogenase, partial [Globisporangium splendens]